jgi:hypothetical protein
MKWPLFRNAGKSVRPAQRPVTREPAEPEGRFHAVEVVSHGDPCEEARKIRETRFLSSENPPTLPLAGCDRAATCACRYRHHADRRHLNRRSGDRVWDTAAPRPAATERRYLIGRRVTDWAERR